jgi:CheY-like chemotaxis protein
MTTALPTSLSILNVDDNDAARYVKRRILSGAGHDVIDAACGTDALAALEHATPHVALIDVKLPDMSGFELTRRIRSGAATKDLTVIQLSAICVTPDDERDGLASGADAYIVTPVEPAQLLALVDHVHRARQASDAAVAAPEPNTSRMRMVEAFIRSNLDSSLSVNELAKVAGLSPFYFARSFKVATGVTPHEYVLMARLEQAMALLESSDLPIQQVGRRTGFSTAAHFSSVFRRKAGCAPRTFRERRKAREASG